MHPFRRAVTLVGKLRGRSFEELGERAAQQLAALGERTGLRDRGEPTAAQFRTRLTSATSTLGDAALLADFRRRGAARFFRALADRSATVDAVQRIAPLRSAEIVRAADDLLAGRIALLGHPPLSFGDPIDWQYDPVLRVRPPSGHWSRIPYLDARVAGDHKLIWELNRHQWLVTLGMAAWMSGDARYAERALALVEQWISANPPKAGVNWASSLEVGFRAVSWCWLLHFVRDSVALTPARYERIVAMLDVHARHLERYLSTWFSPNTHLTGEALGLLYVGSQFPELAGATRWRDRGWNILLGKLPRHVLPDGVYFEQATHYHRYTLDIYVHARVLGAAANLPGVERIDEALGALATHLMWIARPDGTMPLTGDEDGGRLFFFDARANDDVRSPLATVATLLGRSDLAFTARQPTDELVWMLGPTAPAAFDRLEKRPPETTSRAFPAGGIYVMRDGWGRTASTAVIDCAPLGADNCGHAHADTLALEMTVEGRALFVDPGTYTYTTVPELRDHFRSSIVHNTLTLDGVSSSEVAGPFVWRSRTDGVGDAWTAHPAADWFEGHHDGYHRLSAPATHRRGVLHVKGGWWIVRDTVESAAPHDAVVTYQCATGLDARLLDGGDVEISDDGRTLCAMASFARSGHWSIDEGIVSRRYGASDDARRLRFVLTTQGTESITTLVTPGAAADRRVRKRPSATGEIFEITRGPAIDLVMFDAGGVDCDGVRTDADVAWVRRRANDGAVTAFLLVGGKELYVDGALFASAGGGDTSAVLTEQGWRMTGDGSMASERGALPAAQER